MKELSLNILDIVQNSITAEADLIEISITESSTDLVLDINDNGYGMSSEMLASVQDPFSTTRTTRKVGMGIPLLKLAAEQTGGSISISSVQRSKCPDGCGTRITARFDKSHVDYTPLGDIVSTVITLLQGFPEVDYVFTHRMPDKEVCVDTRDMRTILGEDIPLNDPEVLAWVKGTLEEQYA